MMTILHPTYTLRIEIQDKPRETGSGVMTGETLSGRKFSDPINGKTGCDEVIQTVHEALDKAGIRNFLISLESFQHKS